MELHARPDTAAQGGPLRHSSSSGDAQPGLTWPLPCSMIAFWKMVSLAPLSIISSISSSVALLPVTVTTRRCTVSLKARGHSQTGQQSLAKQPKHCSLQLHTQTHAGVQLVIELLQRSALPMGQSAAA